MGSELAVRTAGLWPGSRSPAARIVTEHGRQNEALMGVGTAVSEPSFSPATALQQAQDEPRRSRRGYSPAAAALQGAVGRRANCDKKMDAETGAKKSSYTLAEVWVQKLLFGHPSAAVADRASAPGWPWLLQLVRCDCRAMALLYLVGFRNCCSDTLQHLFLASFQHPSQHLVLASIWSQFARRATAPGSLAELVLGLLAGFRNCRLDTLQQLVLASTICSLRGCGCRAMATSSPALRGERIVTKNGRRNEVLRGVGTAVSEPTK